MTLPRSFGCRLPGLCVAGLAGAIFAGVGPAGAAEPFDSYSDMGGLRLQLGLTAYGTEPALHQPRRFVYETKEQPGRTVFEQLADEAFVLSGKCGATLEASPQLAKLKTGPGTLGMGPDSLGVYDGPKGVACYRITASLSEWLRFDIGSALKDLGAKSFYRLELDIEVKQNARFELQILRGGEPHGSPWVMETGSSISLGSSAVAGANPWACTARSDSGPDSGPGDNCRWVINDLGDGFILRATAGEGSLEGGGDWGPAAYANNSIIFLTDAEVGILGCANSLATGSPYTSTIGDGVTSAQCSVTRVDPTSYGGTCTTNVAYVFRTLPAGPEGCELDKNHGEQVAAVLDVVFPPEPSVPLNHKSLTVIKFPDPATEAMVPFVMPRCRGTLVMDANGDGVRIDGESPDPTIAEVLTDPTSLEDPPGTPIDVIPGGNLEWACILEDEEDFLGDLEKHVRQKILFWGDPLIVRN